MAVARDHKLVNKNPVPLGRRRIHHTAEEQQAANKAKSRRYYEKNKGTEQMRRSVRHREKVKSNMYFLPVASTKEPTQIPRSIPPPSHTSDPLAYWGYRVDRVAIKLDAKMGMTPSTFLDGVCTSYLTSHSKDDVRDTLLIFTPLQKSIYRYMDEILNIAGAGDEYKRAEDVSRRVLGVIHALEDILCKAMLGYDEVCTAFEGKGLLYQS
ncbi:hypothetical protein Hypma_001342 [Hypsizygus marmoreus]|uniref:Uncharacterized protein n=1 Tax=Hypsizygus marmoreus TaxID=39966 RepID=A0A369K974_HYPMA|nr:hypothetical protein Hypma_001342 [Hypsizygus marmoreus]